MTFSRSLVVAAFALGLAGIALHAQAPPNMASARVRYNALKTASKPSGDLKVAIDAVDAELTAALRDGQTAQARRLLAKGTALLSKGSWSPEDDYDQSLVLRTDRVFVDTSGPYTVRLEQTYAPALSLAAAPSARISLRPLLTQAREAPEVKLLREVSDVGRDLRDAPLVVDLDLKDVPDGAYQLEAEVTGEAQRIIGAVALRVTLQQGLEARLSALEALADAAPADLRADIRYPGDYLRRVNRGTMELGRFDLAAELAAAEAAAAAARRGDDPFTTRTGDFERHYTLAAAGEIMPYRVYVPKKYRASQPVPLVVALHGLGGTEDSFFDGYGGRLTALAEKHGYIAVAPLGYRVDGFYGFTYGTDATARRRQELSEADVMQVLSRVQRDYRIDEQRIFLMGHSMGAIGTWFLGAKHADVWAALGAFAGTGNAQSVERMRHIPQFVVHGDADNTVSVNGSRSMVAAMQKHGVDHVYVEVAGGNHTEIVEPQLASMFEFFNTRQRRSPDR